MLSERIAECFRDAPQASTLIQEWVNEAGGADPAFFHDPKARRAIERPLLVISEAAIRLDKLDPAIAAILAPNMDWPGIRGNGNCIRRNTVTSTQRSWSTRFTTAWVISGKPACALETLEARK
jgi:hypothetical protein